MDKKTQLQSKLKKLSAEKDLIYAEMNKLDKERLEKYEYPRLRKYVGSIRKFRNSYDGDNKTWWLYSKIIGFTEGYFKIISFQKDIDGKWQVKERDWESEGMIKSYTLCQEDEYKKAKNELLNYLQSIL